MDHPFPTDYGDHFETSIIALQDIVPALDAICSAIGKSREELMIFDPFFCAGSIRKHMEDMGFPLIWNHNRDFWADVENNRVPRHDVLISSPPFSGDHKERILEFCVRTGTPWMLLMPSYVSTKMYFRDVVPDCLFLAPKSPYEFYHPEGTGKDDPPFASFWFIGANKARNEVMKAYEGLNHVTLASSVDDLKMNRLVRFEKRKSPKQRRRMAKKRERGLI